MNKIIIIADSTCDLEPEYVEKNDIVLTPLHVSFAGDDHDYLDGVDIDSETVYKKVVESGNTPKTGAKNIGEMIELFKKYVDQGCDIIFTGIGSGLSSTYNNAMIAKQEFDDDRIEVVDSGKGIKEEDFNAKLDELVEMAFDDQGTGANPRYPLFKEIKEIYLKAYEGIV